MFLEWQLHISTTVNGLQTLARVEVGNAIDE